MSKSAAVVLLLVVVGCESTVAGSGGSTGQVPAASSASSSGSAAPPEDELPPTATPPPPPMPPRELLLVGICVTELSAREPSNAFRFLTTVKFSEDYKTADLDLVPLAGWDLVAKKAIPPHEVLVTNTRGSHVTTSAPFANDRFVAALGTVSIPAEANSISGRDAVIEDLTLSAKLLGSKRDRFCSTFAGKLTVPYAYSFDPKANTCLFLRTSGTGVIPAAAAADFVCD